MFGLGLTELVIILAIVFLFFGGRKLPELSRGLGLSIRNFKKGLHEPDAVDITPKKEETTSREPPPQKTLKGIFQKFVQKNLTKNRQSVIQSADR